VTEIIEVQCKSALSKSGLPEFDYTLNPYRNCEHGCAYCYAPAIVRIPRAEWGRWVRVKKNVATVLAKELKRKEPGRVGIALVTDPYQPAERKYRLTRYCLEQLARHDWEVSVLTKSGLAVRDLDVLGRFTNAQLGVTLTTVDERVRKAWEPGAGTVEDRLGLLRKAVEVGIEAYVFMGPLVPVGMDELVRQVADTGVKRVLIDDLHLRPGVRADVMKALEGMPEIKTEVDKGLGGEYARYVSEAAELVRKAGLECEVC